ncbi:AaceriAFR581Cp [[Ashbya] aceris (nom. inval.)]|nr:AaceriAFR581Cp [[Ashbya] aceris (nom. inval.)]
MLSLVKTGSKEPIYCDIRVRGASRDTVVLPAEGGELGGELVFSLPEATALKAVYLRLVGRFKMGFLQIGPQSSGRVVGMVKKEQVAFECVWENLLTESEGQIAAAPGRRPGAVARTCRAVVGRRSGGVVQLPAGVTGTPVAREQAPAGCTFVLPAGNYELPFHVVLPADAPETVEGLQSGSLLYALESRLERGALRTPYARYQYLRIFRTLPVDSPAHHEEMYVTKAWPGRLQYELVVSSRAIAVGAQTALQLSLFPFQKGYRLASFTASLIQYYAFTDDTGHVYEDEAVAHRTEMVHFPDVAGCDPAHGNLLVDTVRLQLPFSIPPDLKRITQDCDVGASLIRVRHKLLAHIVLLRGPPDAPGKKTEIKASIPVMLYISPLVPVQGRTVLVDNAGRFHIRPGVLTDLFRTRSADSLPSWDAPPSYESRVHDRLYDGDVGSLASGSAPPDPAAPRPPPRDSPLGLLPPLHSLSLDDLSRVPTYQQQHDGRSLPLHHLSPAYAATAPPAGGNSRT